MGTSSTRGEQSSLHENWIVAKEPTSNLLTPINLYRSRLLVNTVTMDYIEQYILHFICEEDFKDYLTETKWRQGLQHRDPSAYIPPVRAFVDSSSSQLCSRSYTASIYFDRIEMRLTEINDIPYLDGLYMMRVCLQGFKLLYQHFGTFLIAEDQIFINSQGEVKVWINPNLSSIKPNKDKDYQNGQNSRTKIKLHNSLQSTPLTSDIDQSNSDNYRLQEKSSHSLTQQSMILKLLAVIEKNIDHDTIEGRPTFSNFVKQKLISLTGNNGSINNKKGPDNQQRLTQGQNYKQKPIQQNKRYGNRSGSNQKFSFSKMLELYQIYVQEFQLSVPKRMEVIRSIYQNSNNLEVINQPIMSSKNSIMNSSASNDDKSDYQQPSRSINYAQETNRKQINNSLILHNFDESAVTPIKQPDTQIRDKKQRSSANQANNQTHSGNEQLFSPKIQLGHSQNQFRHNIQNANTSINAHKRSSGEEKIQQIGTPMQAYLAENKIKQGKNRNNYFGSLPQKNVLNSNIIQQTHILNPGPGSINIKVKNKAVYDPRRIATDGDVILQNKNLQASRNTNYYHQYQYGSRNSSMQQKPPMTYNRIEPQSTHLNMSSKAENHYHQNLNRSGKSNGIHLGVAYSRSAQQSGPHSIAKYHSPLSTLLEERHDHKIVRTAPGNPQVVKFNYANMNNRHTSESSTPTINHIKYMKPSGYEARPALTPKLGTASKPNSVTIGSASGEQVGYHQANIEKYIKDTTKAVRVQPEQSYYANNNNETKNYNAVPSGMKSGRVPQNGHVLVIDQKTPNATKMQFDHPQKYTFNFNNTVDRTELGKNAKSTKQKEIKYYTSSESYELDSQIAGDLASVNVSQERDPKIMSKNLRRQT